MKRALVCLTLLLSSALGCSSILVPDQTITVAPSKAVYAPGETVTADVFNGSDETVGYGACSLRLEEKRGDEWVLGSPAAVACIDIMYTIQPNKARTIESVDKPQAAGTYRLRMTIYPDTKIPSRDIRSGKLVVRGT